MPKNPNCPACESGDCLEHGPKEGPTSILSVDAPPSGGNGGGLPSGGGDLVTREELERFKHKVGKSVKRLNRAIKEARHAAAGPGEPIPTPADPPPPPEPPKRQTPDILKLGLGVARFCRKKR